MRRTDEQLMALALAEARRGWGRTSPNPMVGAVVARDGEAIAKGFHAKAGLDHAEVDALKKAGEKARGADLYVTLEPCNHQGRTPPCTRAILEAGIKRVVIGAMDPNPRVIGGGADFLISKGVEVRTGVLAERCTELNAAFNKYIVTGKPLVILKSAATLDGKLATATGHSRWVTGVKARHYVHRLRDGVDAILVGRGTVELDDPTLNTRLPGRKTVKDPIRIVLDTRLRSNPKARVFDRKTGGRTIVACGPDPEPSRVWALEERNVEVWPLPLTGGRISLAALVERLGQEQITSLLIEGGAEVNASALLVDRVVDRVLFFYAPKIVGGAAAPTLVGGEGVSTMDACLNLDIIHIKHFGPDILIEAVPRYFDACQ